MDAILNPISCRLLKVATLPVPAPSEDDFRIGVSLIEKLPALLREGQQGFAQTGGLHPAACVTAEGRIAVTFEDIGRHNALDKLIGWSVFKGNSSNVMRVGPTTFAIQSNDRRWKGRRS
jgi:formate dehydrogenase accessory protein FdhD